MIDWKDKKRYNRNRRERLVFWQWLNFVPELNLNSTFRECSGMFFICFKRISGRFSLIHLVGLLSWNAAEAPLSYLFLLRIIKLFKLITDLDIWFHRIWPLIDGQSRSSVNLAASRLTLRLHAVSTLGHRFFDISCQPTATLACNWSVTVGIHVSVCSGGSWGFLIGRKTNALAVSLQLHWFFRSFLSLFSRKHPV